MHKRTILAALTLALLVLACVVNRPSGVARHRWWAGLGPVLPHDDFPADCNLCHVGRQWDTLTNDFEFDHLAETGVPLDGAHQQASCLRCHNDRGPVALFAAEGCGGCHEDIHLGTLSALCTECHIQETWLPVGQIALHNRTRFPLVGTHMGTSCRRCHPGAEIGRFTPTSTECVTCHFDDLNRTTNHIGLGWVDNCDRCHMPTHWKQAEIGF
jgi:hypothetical protein